MLTTILLILVTLLAGCGNHVPTSIELNYPIRPAELEDCKIYRLTNEDGNAITIARCSNSSTTTHHWQGKIQTTTIVVDETEGIQKVRN